MPFHYLLETLNREKCEKKGDKELIDKRIFVTLLFVKYLLTKLLIST
jgi:hypothetical protein